MKKIITQLATGFLILFFTAGVAMAQGPSDGTIEQPFPGAQTGPDGTIEQPFPGAQTGPDGTIEQPTQPTSFGGLENPIAVDSIGGLVEKILDIVLIIGVPIVAFFIIYSGFLFVTARGNPEGLEKAKTTFIYTLIGAALLLGAWVLAQGIADTINSLKS
jgi:hypothetical protein